MKINDIMKQAQQMQEQMQKAQEDMANKEVDGESGAGMVKVVMTGRHDVRRVTIDQSLMSEDKEVLEDLLAAAVNDAVRKVEETSRNAMSGLAGGVDLSNFKMPF
ncbi:MAG: YbaB/EbfC family nucleoid-associated protein [Oceanicoccus sp.]|uniref:YbaB/EbfC family nucleoid-associated protein n=1 Tax=Oceanicoccus sp. TaxID=2691044 RepID=UPI0026187D86|nr:YbaB/EbfC family nucleoid-associated protein [Oceanicoccus sp.]MCP3907587.1 YbaB/EbfC family nucleoid-associated protein [Oceanicoccus sp.]MDG1773674.1 YbaB/EbfC family nucleoid-associated protein [Oceanicoccus sp.]